MPTNKLFNIFLPPPCFFIFLIVMGISLLTYCFSSIWMRTGTSNNEFTTHDEKESLKSNIFSFLHEKKLAELPYDDRTTLINLKNFEFTINHNPCNKIQPFLLIVVHSASENFGKRQVIRDTWANNTPETKVLFFTGSNRTHNDDLQVEKKKYHDIIQGNFIDTYKNLTYKHVMVLKWITYYCPNAKFILKVDDDVFVHHRAVLDFLKHGLSPSGASRIILCNVNFGMTVIRAVNSRWRVSPEEFPDKFYPPYCAGFVIIYSPDSVFLLYHQVQKEPYFWIDDVHVTGTIAKKVGLTHSSLGSLVMKHKRFDQVSNTHILHDLFLFGPVNLEDDEIVLLHRLSSRQYLPLLISYAGVKISKNSLPRVY